MHCMAEIIPYVISKIPFSLAFPGFGCMALSPPTAKSSLCREEAGEREEGKRAVRKEERLPPFPSSHRPPRAYYFSLAAIFFNWKTQLVAKTDRKRAAKFF